MLDLPARTRSKWIVLGLLVMIGAACTSQRHHSDRSDTSLARLELDQLDLRDLEGGSITFGEEGNRGVLLIFITDDCPIANAYMPRIQAIAAQYRDDGIQTVLVHVDPSDSLEDLIAHRQSYGYELPVTHDVDHRLVGLTQATVTPQAVLFSSSGECCYSGRIDDEYVTFGAKRQEPSQHDLVDAIERLLSGQVGPICRTTAVGCYISDMARKAQGG